MRPRSRRLSALILGLAAVAGCGDVPQPTAPARLATASSDDKGKKLLFCPSSVTTSALVTLGPSGGNVQIGGVRLSVPDGAVSEPTTFSIKIPAGRYLKADIHAVGESSYRFNVPITITLNYRRCGDVDGPFRAWYVDDETNALLEDMGGVTDGDAGTHTFETNHLSGYAIAN